MSEKKPKYCYGSQNYIELACGVKVEPAPCNTKGGLRCQVFSIVQPR